MLKNSLFLFLIAAWLSLGLTGSAIAQSSNKNLESRVRAVLSSYYMHNLYVSADDNGKVIIEGKVDALYDRLDIYQLASRVNGVTAIQDMVKVDTPMLPDDIINMNIVRAIKDNSVILEPDKITVAVTDGLVFLKGTVSYYQEKLMAETVSAWQDGVKGIDNEINVLPSQEAISDENIKNVLNEIIENKFPLIDGKVQVNVKNGDVDLEGKVLNLWEKNNLKKECLQVEGVKIVSENLKIIK